MKSIGIGLLGLGTVGVGVAKLLLENQDVLRARVGTALNLRYAADIDTTDRGLNLPAGVLVNDAFKVVADPEIDIVVEMIGGKTVAKELIAQSLKNKKHVVTANKALIAENGNELLPLAVANEVELAYEASVGGCMPIIKTLRESLVGNRIQSTVGILNGTCNYILTKITDEGIDFETALQDAQAGGFAEADPGLDVDGHDTAHKLAIVNSLAYGMPINLHDIYLEGIRKITPTDIEFARRFGYRIKLLAIGKNHGDRVEARIHPTMIPEHNLLSQVNGTLNAIMVEGDAVGRIVLNGHGAGRMPTASAVIGDIVDIARNMAGGMGQRVPTYGYLPDHIRPIEVMPMDEIVTHYYFRFNALDKPGVLSAIAGVLGKHLISLKSVEQVGRGSGGTVPLVMLTHRAKEADIQKAMTEITHLDVVANTPMLIRIEDNHNS